MLFRFLYRIELGIGWTMNEVRMVAVAGRFVVVWVLVVG